MVNSKMNIDQFTAAVKSYNPNLSVIDKAFCQILEDKAEDLCCTVKDLVPVMGVDYDPVMDTVTILIRRADNYPEYRKTYRCRYLYDTSHNLNNLLKELISDLEEYLEPIVANLSEVNKEKIAEKRRADWDAALKTRLRDMLPPRI
jgi:hypothetical protein